MVALVVLSGARVEHKHIGDVVVKRSRDTAPPKRSNRPTPAVIINSMRFHPRLWGAFALFLSANPLIAQRAKVDHDAALAHARAGFEFEQKKEYKYALYEYDTAAKLDTTYPYPVERIGGMYQVLKNYPLAISAYERSIKLDSAFDDYAYYNLGLSFHVVQKYDSAVMALKEFIKRMDPVNKEDSARMFDADWWIKFNLGCIVEQAKPKNTEEPVPLKELNSNYDDFGPTETADGNTLYFTSRRPGTNAKQEIETGDYGEDIFWSHRDSLGHWVKPTPLPPPLNSVDDEGAAFVTADGQTMYLSLCRRPDGMGDCDIYVSHLVGDLWTKPQPLGHPLNSTAWDANPTVTADGLTMYFSSRRMGSIEGSEDIYVSYKSTDGSWTVPHNLGEPVNTRFNERSPFISADGKTLYFSSNGHPGFGNHDLFMTRKLDDGTWSVPVNLGRPINAYGDDVFLTIPASGDKIIYSSQRDNAAHGALNLYEAKLPLEFRPGPVTLVAGMVYDKETLQPLAAEVDVNDLKTDKLVAVYHSNKVSGKFYITLGTGKEYGVTATAAGYAPFSDHYTVPDTISYREVTHDLPLTRLPNYAGIVGNDTGSAGNAGKGHENGGTGGNDGTNGKGGINGKVDIGNGNANNRLIDHSGDSLFALLNSEQNRGNVNENAGNRNGNIGSIDHSGDSLFALLNNGQNNGNSNENNGYVDHSGDSLLALLNNGQNSGNSNENNGSVDHSGDSLLALMNENNSSNGGQASGQIDTSGIELHNVFFDFDKATLRPESHSELNYWVDLLKKYPVLKIEIDGHTDSVGTAAYNLKLSLARAQAVKSYLVANGVKAKQLVPKGFGATQPKASNATDEGRQRNRRTEFRFIKS